MGGTGRIAVDTVLTVRAGAAHSHATFGWEAFTDEVIRQLDKEREHLVFMLWGSHAQKKGAFIDRNRHFGADRAASFSLVCL